MEEKSHLCVKVLLRKKLIKHVKAKAINLKYSKADSAQDSPSSSPVVC